VLPLLADLPRRSLDPATLSPAHVDAIYVHVPFCFHKCHYCDFYSITRQTPERMSRFVALILAEARLWQTHHATPTTVFFGGGTPSLLPALEMRRLIVGLREAFDFSRVTEFSIEVNPATADFDYLCMLRESGVDRLSFGAQSFHQADLKVLERHHDPQDVHRSVEMARRARFERLNLDLIYAVPGQTLEAWDENLSIALALGTEHLSCYALTYEESTAMTVRKRLGQFKAATESLELDMMRLTRDRLASSGLPAYEISNHARLGRECRHNLAYWQGKNYIGIGPSAASHLAGTRFKNLPHLGEWETAVDNGIVPAADIETLTPARRCAEMIMSGLRLSQGVDLQSAIRVTGVEPVEHFASVLGPLVNEKLLLIGDDRWTLTPRGIEVADGIASQFLALA